MTLIEVMIALVVATVGLLGALAMLSTLVSGSSFSRATTEASMLAQSRIEQLQSLRGVTISPPNPPDGWQLPDEVNLDGSGAVVAGPPAGIFTRSTWWGPSTDNSRRTIQVRVQWKDSFGKDHFVWARGERIP
jgi:type II secretory pathway pseudopilin PulG